MHWTVREASEFLQVSEDTIYDWIKKKGLPTNKYNGRYHFNRLKLIDWAQENHLPFLVQNGVNLPSLKEALEEGGIYENIQGAEKADIIKNIVDLLKIPIGEDRKLICQMILSREKEGSTELGNGIAVPHARHPILMKVAKPMIALCYLKNPIKSCQPNGTPVFILFVIFSPSIRMHLHFLERLGFALRDKEFSRLILTQASKLKVMDRLSFIEKDYAQRK